MATKRWLKWHPEEWEQETAPLSNLMRGYWSVIKGRTIKGENPGTCSYSTTEWANILRAPEKEIASIFKYLNESPLDVFTDANDDSTTITIKYLPIITEYNQQEKYKINRIKKDNEKRREKLLEFLKCIYHPQKSNIQTVKSKKIFMQLMEEAANNELKRSTRLVNSNKLLSNKKIRKQMLVAEKREFIKIKNYIIILRESPDWERHNGKYLLGFGNFLESRMWEKKTPNYTPKINSTKIDPTMQALKELYKDEHATSGSD